MKTSTSTQVDQRGPGRPREEGLRERIIDAAREQITTSGTSVSLLKIAEVAGTSKVTLYSYFRNKEDLFKAVLETTRTRTVGVSLAGATPTDVKSSLHSVARAYIDLITGEDIAAITILLLQQSDKTPQLARTFCKTGPEALTESLARYLESVPHLQIECYRHAAEQFMGMVRGGEQLRALLKLPPGRRGKAREAYLRSCVELSFTWIYATVFCDCGTVFFVDVNPACQIHLPYRSVNNLQQIEGSFSHQT